MLASWNNSPRIDMPPHCECDTFSWFWANQSLIFLLNDACLAQKQQIPILLPLVWPDQGSNPQSRALEASTLTIPPLIQFALNVNERLHEMTEIRWHVFYDKFQMMRNLWLNEGDLVEVENVSLQVATFTKFQPQSVDFLDITNPKAVYPFI